MLWLSVRNYSRELGKYGNNNYYMYSCKKMNNFKKVGIGDGGMQLIVRKEYLNELIELYGTPDIKVITGIRRNGKSVLLQEFVSYLQSLEEPVNIVMINLQEVEFDHLLEYHALHKYVLEQ